MTITKQTLPFDVQKIRDDFPILHKDHHEGVPLVFLDNAASSQKPAAVIDAMTNYYQTYHANVHRGIHKLSEEATAAYEGARKNLRDFLNAPNHRQIIFTRGTTDGINLVAHTWGRKFLSEGDVVLSTEMEHHSNIVPWQILAEEKGFTVKYIPVLEDSTLDMEAYAQLLDEHNVKLVTVVHSSNVLGTVNPVKEMAQQAHDHSALILVDAAQSVPHMPVDVQDLDCDFLVFSGHKMAGPTGIGILYGKRDALDSMPPYQGGGDMISKVTLEGSTWNDLPYKFEAGTPSIAEAIGLGAAADYLSEIGMDKIHTYEHMLTEYALERLATVDGLTLYGPDASKKGAVAAFTLENAHAHDVAQVLDSYGVAVRAGHHCAMPLHDILCISASARASFYIYNTFEEIDVLVESLGKVKDTFIL
ncbi:MAG: cysteine desulfurase [Chloroflexota bacterium]